MAIWLSGYTDEIERLGKYVAELEVENRAIEERNLELESDIAALEHGIRAYKNLTEVLEDKIDILSAEKAKDEPTVSWESVKAKLMEADEVLEKRAEVDNYETNR